jgi:hypothetical protein
MVKLMSDLRTVILKWKKYTCYEDVRSDNEAWSEDKDTNSQGKGIYLMADSKGTPLYIGMAYGKWGFADRYNATGFLDAAIRSAGNLIFFAKVDSKSLCKDIETQLLWEEKPKYNKRIPTPQRNITIKHEGQVPNLGAKT